MNTDLSGMVIGMAMKIHRILGPGYLEEVYKNALMLELTRAGLNAEKEVPLKVLYDGVVIGNYAADIIVEDKLVLELKAVSQLHQRHEIQLINYLTTTRIDDGILINFGADSLQFKHKYRTYKPKNPSKKPPQIQPSNPKNPANRVNPLQEIIHPTSPKSCNLLNPVQETYSNPALKS